MHHLVNLSTVGTIVLADRTQRNDNCPIEFVSTKNRIAILEGIMRSIYSIKRLLTVGGLFAAIFVSGSTVALAQDYEQRRSDRRSRQQQSWSDRNSRRQQQWSDRNSRRQQNWSDRNSRRYRTWGYRSWGSGRRWNNSSYWRWRRYDWNDRRRRGRDDDRRGRRRY
jgi:hypothetical protein